MGIIKQLDNAGSISVYQDYRAGHFNDLSTKAKNGTPTAINFSKGANFDGATSQVSIGDIGNIRAIFFSIRPNNLTGNILELINNLSYVTYASGTLATTGFTSSTIYVNGVAGTTISSDKSYLVCITDSANIAAASTIIGEANGTFFNGNIGCFLALSVMPTVTQISQITSELQNTVWPTNVISKSLPTTSSIRNGLIGEWLLDNVSGVTAPDSSPTAVNGTINSGCVIENDTLGKSLSFNDSTGKVDLTYLSAITVLGTYTMSVWFKVKSQNAGSIINFSNASSNRNGITLYDSFPSIGVGTYNGTDYTTRIMSNLPHIVNNWVNVIFTNNAGTISGYLNGATFTDVQGTTNTALGGAGQNHIGYNSNATYFNGNIKNVQVWNRVLSVQEIQSIYESGKKTIPLETNFGVVQSVSAEGGVVGQFIDKTIFQCAETTGRWQVATSTINGTLTKTLKNTTAGRIYIDMSKFGNTAEAAYGKWEFWINKADTSAFNLNIMNTTSAAATAGNNGYTLQFDANEALTFASVANGVLTNRMTKASAISAATWTKITLTRTVTGSWSLYFNDGLVGSLGTGTNPVTENTYTTAQYLVIECLTAANIEIALGDVSGNKSFVKGYFA